MKHPFGDPRFPRQNLTVGALILALSSGLVGMMVSGMIGTHGSRWIYLVSLVIYLGLVGIAVAQFRIGLRSVPPDPPERDMTP